MKLPFKVGISPNLKIRGLIATEKISKAQEIERCPAIVYTKNESVNMTIFEKYVFEWDEKKEALALGYGSLCNHSSDPNLVVDLDFENNEVIFTALRNIEEGEELTINYNDDSSDPVDPMYLDFDGNLEF